MQKELPETIYLFLGGGNLSFELSFAQKHPELAKFMVVTTYEDEASFRRDGMAIYHKNLLEQMGVRVIHGIDAKKLETYPLFKGKRLKRIYFSHPLALTKRAQVRNETASLLEEFFISAAKRQEAGDRIIIPRRRNNVGKAAKNGYYKLLRAYARSI